MHEALVALLVVVGALFCLVGSIGLVRLPDVYMRLHAPTKASTLGVGSILLGAVAFWAAEGTPLRELLILIFIFITAPVSALLIGRAALHRRLPGRAPLPPPDGGA